MIARTEVETSSFKIAKAESRLAHQRSVVKKLGMDSDVGYALLANDLLELMEERIVILRQRHVHLVARAEIEGQMKPKSLN